MEWSNPSLSASLFITIMWTVYVIKSQINNKLYIGYSENFNQRLKEHNAGKVRSTKAYKPYYLIYSEIYPDKTMARKREIYLKSGIGREFLKSCPPINPSAGPPVAEKPL